MDDNMKEKGSTSAKRNPSANSYANVVRKEKSLTNSAFCLL